MLRFLLPLTLLLHAAVAQPSQESEQNKSVIGPRNVYLYDGAQALMEGDGKEGVRLTLRGLEFAVGHREQKLAHSNLCAGFILLKQAETALEHCNWVLERDPNHWRTYNNRALVLLELERYEESEADIKKGQELNPRSEKLKEVKGIYLDEVAPVDEKITIDDRREGPTLPDESPE